MLEKLTDLWLDETLFLIIVFVYWQPPFSLTCGIFETFCLEHLNHQNLNSLSLNYVFYKYLNNQS